MSSVQRLFCGIAIWVFSLSGCQTNTIVDSNISMPSRNWNYANKVKVLVSIKDVSKPYRVRFKLRHTSDYAYSNIFVLLNIKGAKQKPQTRRFEYRLAQPDGEWNGSGSGNLYTYSLPMFDSYQFPVPGNYELEIEQNMRDNPLKGISDAGITVERKAE